MWMVHICIAKIVAIIFPPYCLGCQKEGFSFCNTCLAHSRKSIDTPAIFITSVYSFRDPMIKKAIHAIKYFHRQDLVLPLTNALVQEIKHVIENNKETTEMWTLIPIPMPRIRKYIRGYNQAECIAKILAKKCSLSLDTTSLIRPHISKRQVTTRTRSERLQNQHNSFEVIGNVKNINIILVDDVTTTGATLIEARKTLLQAGANTVHAITIAH